MISIHDKLDRIEAKLDANTEQTIRNTTNLVEHMRRTENLETRVVPLEVQSARLGLLLPALGALGTLSGIAAALWAVFGA